MVGCHQWNYTLLIMIDEGKGGNHAGCSRNVALTARYSQWYSTQITMIHSLSQALGTGVDHDSRPF